MDPLCEKYYSISPYSYCGGNPVNRIDPDGADWVLVSGADGEKYEWRDDVTSADDIYENGVQYIGRHATDMFTHAGLKMPSDAIASIQKLSYIDENSMNNEIDMYEINDNYWGNKAFEFLANKTNVEWGLFSSGNTMLNIDGKTFLTTTKKTASEVGGRLLPNMLKTGSSAMSPKIIQKHVHNHPGNTPTPSGADMEFASGMSSMFPNMSFMVYTRQYGYKLYDQYGIILLPSITIIGKRK